MIGFDIPGLFPVSLLVKVLSRLLTLF